MKNQESRIKNRPMPIPFRSDLRPFLTEFAEEHRGVRLGQMFGLPAIYVGRRLVTCLMEDGIIVRLPSELARQEIQSKRGKPYSRRGRESGGWVMYTPRSAAAARKLTPMIERAARHIAERQVEEITGIKRRRRS
jgi:hypothetical protein